MQSSFAIFASLELLVFTMWKRMFLTDKLID